MKPIAKGLITTAVGAMLSVGTAFAESERADADDVSGVIDTYIEAYEARDEDALVQFFPPAFFAAAAVGHETHVHEARKSVTLALERILDNMPPADDSRLEAHWTRWKNRTDEITETHLLNAGGHLMKVAVTGEYELLGHHNSGTRTLIAVQHDNNLYLMDPAYSHLRHVMTIAYPQITDADGKGYARTKKLEN